MKYLVLTTVIFVSAGCGTQAHRPSNHEAASAPNPSPTEPQSRAPTKHLEYRGEAQKIVHDVFPMGPYRVDLSSQGGHCHAEVYAFGDPFYGPNLQIPLGMKAPCFVRRQVLPMPSNEDSGAHAHQASLGGPYLYRHKKGSVEILVTMLIGDPISVTTIDFKEPPKSLRCGQKWVYFSEQNGSFGISEAKIAEKGICALKAYIDHMKRWGFDPSYLGDKKFPLPKRAKGRVHLDDSRAKRTPRP